MATIVPETASGKGKLVALEGDADVIETQLRLLPPSQKFLILPALLENIPEPQDGDIFDARLLVRDLHKVFTDRTEKARSFLQSSTEEHPRLVFMNGGSSKARATCISRIAEHITEGDIDEALTIFNEIVADGVFGLMKHAAEAEAEAAEADDSSDESEYAQDEEDEGDIIDGGVDGGPEKGTLESSNPTLKAMKLADSLDQKTAAIETEGPAGLASPTDMDSRNHPGYAGEKESARLGLRSMDSSQESKPESPTVNPKSTARETVPTAPSSEDSRTTIMTLPAKTNLQEKRNTFGPHTHTVTSSSASDVSNAKSDFTDDVDADTDLETLIDPEIRSLKSENLVPISANPKAEYGKACIVEVQSTEKKRQIKKVSSVDRFSPELFEHEPPYPGRRSLKHTTSAYHLPSTPMTAEGFNNRRDDPYQAPPRSSFARTSHSLIPRLQAESGFKWPSVKSIAAKNPLVFVDRGTDPISILESDPKEMDEDDIFVPVFPLAEELVINMVPKGSNEIYDRIIASYRDGSYPVFPESEHVPEADHITESLISPVSTTPTANEPSISPISESHDTVETKDDPNKDSYDPYADGSYEQGVGMNKPSKEESHGPDNAALSTEPPAPNLGTTISAATEKFLDFSPANIAHAISVQNSLRQVLGAQFPSHLGYTQHFCNAGTSADRLWKPVFRNDDNATIGSEGRTVDQIVALGSEDGVKKDFFAQISGQIERLGIKMDGNSRSGKLDIRFLILNILQGPNIPSALQRDPLADPQLLATLLVTQLEGFLAVNHTTRFLILQYSPEHLATIFALRKLLGIDLLKVAGILDTLASDPPSFSSRPRTPNGINPLSNEATSTRSRVNSLRSSGHQVSVKTIDESKKRDPETSFSKANYLLPSAATDAEITTFLSGIWKVLMEKSAFYAPEPPPTPAKSPQPPRTPLPKTPTSSIHGERDSGYPPSSFRAPRERESKVSRLTGASIPQGVKNHKYAPSIASTTRTTASERGRREDREWENFYIAEDDSDDDAYDRMILGRGYAKIVPEVKKVGQKRNTKKALKWLGLA